MVDLIWNTVIANAEQWACVTKWTGTMKLSSIHYCASPMKWRGIWWLQERPSSRIHASSATFNLYTHLQTGPNFVGVLCPNFLEPVGNYSSLSRAGKHARFSSFLTTKKIIISIPPHNLRLVNQSFCGQNKTRTSTRALTVLESFRSEIENEEEYEFVCLVTVRMCSCRLPVDNDILKRSLLHENEIYKGESCTSNSSKIMQTSSWSVSSI